MAALVVEGKVEERRDVPCLWARGGVFWIVGFVVDLGSASGVGQDEDAVVDGMIDAYCFHKDVGVLAVFVVFAD